MAGLMLARTPPLKPERLLIEPRTERELFTNTSEFVRCEVVDDTVSDMMLEMVQHMVENISQCRPAIDDLLMMEWRDREPASADTFPLFLKIKAESKELFCPNQIELQMTTMLFTSF